MNSRKEYLEKYYQENKDKIKERSKTWYNDNKDKRLEYQRDWVSKNKEKSKLYKRNWKLKNEYNITEEQFQDKLKEQNNCCAICKSEISKIKSSDKLHIDHDHKTGKFRGILCYSCNTGLGKFEDNIEYLKKALEYLKQNNING